MRISADDISQSSDRCHWVLWFKGYDDNYGLWRPAELILAVPRQDALRALEAAQLLLLEAGHPGTALTSLASALQVFGELEKLGLLMDTQADTIGLALMDAELPIRIHSKRRRTPKAF